MKRTAGSRRNGQDQVLPGTPVAGYYRHTSTSADSPQRKQLLELIEDVRKRSRVLDEELSKKP
jgi:hypothetical protein